MEKLIPDAYAAASAIFSGCAEHLSENQKKIAERLSETPSENCITITNPKNGKNLYLNS